MKNTFMFKMKLSILLVLLACMNCYCGWPLDKPAKELSDGMKESSKNFKDAAYITSERIERSAGNISEALPKASSGFGESAARTIRDGLLIATGIYTAGNIAIGIKNYFFPSMDYKIREKTYEVKCKTLIAEYEERLIQSEQRKACLLQQEQLKACLLKNHHTARSESGRPMVCENIAQQFAMSKGNNDELNKITETFNTHFKKQS